MNIFKKSRLLVSLTIIVLLFSCSMSGAVTKPLVNQPLPDWTNIHSKPEITVGDAGYVTFAAAVTAIGSTPATLVIPSGTHVGGGVTVPITLALKVLKGANVTIADAATLTINAPFEAGLYQVFTCTGTGAVVFGAGAVKEVLPQWWGFAANATAAINATALQAAINSLAPKVVIPNGSYSYSVGLTIDRAICFEGAGSCQNNGGAGDSTTILNYTGAFLGIDLVGSGANGKQNIHLRNFSLSGTFSAATGGILVGSGTNVALSSIINVHVTNFTKTKAYGIKFSHALEMDIELYSQWNYDNVIMDDGCTTMRGRVITRSAWHKAFYAGYLVGADLNIVTESNSAAGLELDGVQGGYFFVHSESNNTAAKEAPDTAPIIIGRTASTGYTTITGFIADKVGNLVVDADKCSRLLLLNIGMSYAKGFMKATSNTGAVVLTPVRGTYNSDVTGNADGRVNVINHDGIDAEALTNYSSTSVVTGWSSTTIKSIYYKRSGNKLNVTFVISGISDATVASFTTPYTVKSLTPAFSIRAPGQGVNNGVDITTPIMIYANPGASTITLYTDWGGAGWTASGTKSVYGSFDCIID